MNIKNHCIEPTMVEISTLKPSPMNPNKHPKDQIERLAEILKYQGWRYPIKVSSRSGFITSGHGRVEAAKLLGLTWVPVMVQDYESDDQELADIVSDNSIASWSDLDLSFINSEMVPTFDPQFNLDWLGIKDFELDPKQGRTDEDAVPEVKTPISKLGDLWVLGNHRLLCGDSTDVEQVKRLMNGEMADMVFTSPPYNLGKSGFEEKGKYDNAKDDNEGHWLNLVTGFLRAWMTASSYQFVNLQILSGNKVKIHEWLNTYKEHFVDQFSLIKSTLPAMEPNVINSDFENMYVFSSIKNPTRHINLGKDFRGNISNVYEMKRSAGEFAKVHRATFHVSFPEYFIETFLKNNGSVADPFGGSGSTLIACEKTNRKCFGMEIDPHYVDVICQRWVDFSGGDPVREDGAKWSDLKQSSLSNPLDTRPDENPVAIAQP